MSCTGLTATWCQVHGDCTCPLDDDGCADFDDTLCPLHGGMSNHPRKLRRTVVTRRVGA